MDRSRCLLLPRCLLLLVLLTPLLDASSTQAQDCAPPPTDMVSWWPLEGSVNDIRGSNEGASLEVVVAAGKVGQALYFDGSFIGPEEIVVPHNPSLLGRPAITIDAWINPVSPGHGRPIAQMRSAGNLGGYTFESHWPGGGSTGLHWVIWIGGEPQDLIASGVVTIGGWQHVAATYDGTAMRIYVNGGEVASQFVAGMIDSVGEPFVVGRNTFVPGFVWDGLIDDVHVFSRALTAAEIDSIYQLDSAGMCHAASGIALKSTPGIVLSSNSPNPFHHETVLRYELATASDVQLTVYDVSGRLVRSLVHGRQRAGSHSVYWDGTNELGTGAPAGVYFYLLRAGGSVLTRKTVMLN